VAAHHGPSSGGWTLFNVVGSLALGVISDRLLLAFTLATALPYFAVTTRRLHDTDRGGWWQLVSAIPIIGSILIIVWCAQEGRNDTRFAVQAA